MDFRVEGNQTPEEGSSPVAPVLNESVTGDGARESPLRPLRALNGLDEFGRLSKGSEGFAAPNGETPMGLPWERAPGAPRGDIPWRCKTRQNLTDASLPWVRRDMARAWRLILALRMSEAREAIDQIELQLDDLPPSAAKRLLAATQLLRAVGLALQDDSLTALAIAVSHLRENPADADGYIATTLCRLGFWRLGKFEAFHSLPRHPPRLRWSRSHATSAIFDLSIEAAVALDHLHLSTAKRLASDALAMAQTAKAAAGLAALPASLAAQALYEEGCLDEADNMLRDRLPAINAEGSSECALRAYVVLARIARQRMQFDFGAILLREAETLGERRGWPRLVAASVAERVSLLLEVGRVREARLAVEYLDRYATAHSVGSDRSCAEIANYRTVARWRVAWAEAPSREAVAALRRLYHRAVERRDLYAACRLAVELAEMLSSIGEVDSADALFFHMIRSGAAAGLYQVFLERGGESGVLLRRAYDRADAAGSADRDVQSFVGSLLSQWERRQATGIPVQTAAAISDTLTARERAILEKISDGLPNKRIARALEISPETVKSHVKRIFLKLAVSNRTEALSRGRSLGLL
jgi:ATP/maltotriose-dependent transcriptional regulator MalT